jgi:hypothetical protein
MNLKPLRDYSEHEVLPFFSTQESSVDKGTFMQIVSFDPDNHNGFGASLSGVPDGAYSASYEVYAKVKKAAGTGGGASATGVIGVALLDVTGSNPNVWTVGDQMRYFDKIKSGQALPILKRGVVFIAGHSGTATPGAKGVVITDGQLVAVSAGTTSNVVGTFLSTTGADGYALFQVNCI